MNLHNNIHSNHEDELYDKIIHSARALSLTKDKQWIERMVFANNICVDNGYWESDFANNYLKEMFQIIDALEVAYKDNWDMHITAHYPDSVDNGHKQVVYRLQPIICYPEITITNSAGLSRIIKDLIVLIPLNKNDDFDEFTFRIGTIQGNKYCYDYNAYKHSYVHSHLHTGKPQSFNSSVFEMDNFCIGSDTEIGEITMEINANGFNEGLFGLYLTVIDTIVRWESLEGTPYAYMKKITDTSKEKEINYPVSTLDNYYTLLRPNLQNIQANFIFNQGRYQIKNDSKFFNYLKDFIINYDNGRYTDNLLCKEKEGKFYSPITALSITPAKTLVNSCRNSSGEVPYVFIQGRKVEFRISNPNTKEKININEYNVYPKFIDYVIRELEKELYENAIRSSVLATQSTLINS